MEGKSYRFRNSVLTLRFGNIIDSDAEVIVSSDDNLLTMSAGVSQAIRLAGGLEIFHDTRKFLPLKRGDVIVTTAGRLKQKYIFHAVSRLRKRSLTEKDDMDYVLKHTVGRCFELALALGISSIAFPPIGAGFARYPIAQVAARMAEDISDCLLSTSKVLNVTIWLYDRNQKMKPIDFGSFFDEFDKATQKIGPTWIPFVKDSHAEKPKVFISYARKDCIDDNGTVDPDNVVYKVRGALEQAGLSVWMDVTGILSGDEFAGAITDGIRACKVVVFISSESSNASKNCTREMAIADRYGKPVIPLRIDDSDYNSRIAFYLATANWTDYHPDSAKAIESVVESVMRIASGEATEE